MDNAIRGRLGKAGRSFRWLFEPAGDVTEAGRSFLLGELLSAPAAAIMGSFCAILVVATAFSRSGESIYGLFAGLEATLLVWRLRDWRRRTLRWRANPAHVPVIDTSVLLSTFWCALQGGSTFTIMSSGDPVLQVLSATLVMAILGPICARNYAAPRFAFLLVLLCDLPFVAGAVASNEPWLMVTILMTPPFLVGAMQIITTFHRAMLGTLAAEAKNRHLAEHDSLTGILNRQGMDAALGQIPPHSNRKMALISIDLDGFKQVNDSHGHGAGDLLLMRVSERIQEQLGDNHLFGRMGGDEFMVVMRNISPIKVRPFVESLIAAISHRPYDLGSGTVARVGASIGYACLPEDATNTVELRLRADQALYAAKGAGKGVGLRYGVQLDYAATPSTGVVNSSFKRLVR